MPRSLLYNLFVSSNLSFVYPVIRTDLPRGSMSPISALAVLTQRAYYVSLRNKAVVALLSSFILALVACGITHAVVAVETSAAEMVEDRGICRV